jgi:RNA polymerase sigma factor (sigma-70 family)
MPFKQIDRYLAKLIFVPLVGTLCLAAMLLIMDRMLRLFDFVVSEGGPVTVVWRMLANLIPEYLGLAVPVGLTLGILLAFRKLALSSELDTLRAVGLGYGRLMRVPYFYAFILLAAKASTLNDDVLIGGWLYNAVRFVARDEMRRDQRRTSHEQKAAAMAEEFRRAAAPGKEDAWSNAEQVLDEAMNDLDEPTRGLLVLRYFQGKSANDVAQRLGISERTVKAHRANVMQKLNVSSVPELVQISVRLQNSLIQSNTSSAPI